MKSFWLAIEGLGEEGPHRCLYPLSKGTITIGRSEECDIVVQGGKVSRKHAEITLTDEELSFRDLGSAAGVFLNGTMKTEGVLTTGDEFVIARVSFKVSDSPDELPAPQPVAASGEGNWQHFDAFLTKLRESTDPQDLLERLLLGLVDILGAERGFVLLKANDAGRLETVVSHQLGDTEEFLSISKTVYQRALDEMATVFIGNTLEDRWYMANTTHTFSSPRSIVCGPLVAGGEAIGVLYIDGSTNLNRERLTFFDNVTSLSSELLSATKTRKRLLAARGAIAALSSLSWEGDKLILGNGESAQKLKQHLELAASQDVSVLITGETGTGKEMVARALHRLSPRAHGPFVPVDCASLARDIVEAELFGAEKGAFTGAVEQRIGRFELATGGTLFLDELGELPMDIQTKLLRVLQERMVTRLGGTEPIKLDFRLVCATNRDLESEVQEGTFRQDLFYRVNVFRLQLEPLRVRRDAIMPMAKYFLDTFAARFARAFEGFSAEAESTLLNHHWPGNVRELRNAIERAALVETSAKVRPESLPLMAPAKSPSTDVGRFDDMPRDFKSARDFFERIFIERSLKLNKGNVSAAARETGLTRRTIYNKINALGLKAEE